jgi:hypothetical protein
VVDLYVKLDPREIHPVGAPCRGTDNDPRLWANIRRPFGSSPQDREVADRQREALDAAGLAPEEVERAMEPLLSFQAARAEEIGRYEAVRSVRRGD